MSASSSGAGSPTGRRAEADVRLEGVTKRFGDTVAVDGIDLDDRARRVLQPARALRLRQVDDALDDRRLRGADVRRGLPRRARRRPGAAVPARRQHRLPVLRALPAPRRVRANVAFGLRRRKRSAATRSSRRVGAGARARRPRRAREAQARASSRAASSSGSRSPGRSSTSRGCFCSTSRSGALDLKLRKQMQLELKRIQQEVGITFLYVTHDQEEAIVMSDRLAVMNHGRIEQIGSPEEVYDRPATEFVAEFLGASNLLPGTVSRRRRRRRAASRSTAAPTSASRPTGCPGRATGSRWASGPRSCGRSRRALRRPARTSWAGTVVAATYLGLGHQLVVEGPAGTTLTVYVQNSGDGPPRTGRPGAAAAGGRSTRSSSSRPRAGNRRETVVAELGRSHRQHRRRPRARPHRGAALARRSCCAGRGSASRPPSGSGRCSAPAASAAPRTSPARASARPTGGRSRSRPARSTSRTGRSTSTPTTASTRRCSSSRSRPGSRSTTRK